MKKEFSSSWVGSKQPRKQRKYVAKAPIHVRKKFLSVTLSKDLRKKNKIRNIVIRKGDLVKIIKGKFKKRQGKVLEVKVKVQKIIVEGIQSKKQDSSKVNVPLRPANVQIIELNMDDKKRLKSDKLKGKIKTEMKEKNQEVKEEKN